MSELTTARAPATIESIQHNLLNTSAYETLFTSMEGIFLRVEAGTKPPITERALGEFALVSAEYAQRQARLAELTKQQVRPGNAIKLMAQTCVGLRGIES